MLTDYNINLTDSALRKIRSFIGKNKNSVLRVAVLGGGCSGFKYSFFIDQVSKNLSLGEDNDNDIDYDDEFDNDDDYDEVESYRSYFSFNRNNKDIIVNDENGNPVLMVDICSAKLLRNSVIDYIENLSGSRFQVKNALAKSQCGCGNSFSI